MDQRMCETSDDEEYTTDGEEYSTHDEEYTTDGEEYSTHDKECSNDDEYKYEGSSRLDYSKADFSNVVRTSLDKSDSEYLQVLKKFQKAASEKTFYLTVKGVEKIINRELLWKFNEKKREYEKKYGHYRVVKVFHGTKSSNISSILKKNLQVERHGQNRGERFGAGVYFSAFACYASYFCDESDFGDQMLLCNVIISNIIEVPEVKKGGQVLMKPPFLDGRKPLRYDTTAKDKRSMNVIVKFENHTYYPAYVVHFLKTKKFGTLPPGSLSVDKSTSQLLRTKTLNNAVENKKIAAPITVERQQISKRKRSRPRRHQRHKKNVSPKQVSRPSSCGAARHQEKIAPEQVSRPGTAKLQGNVLPKQVSRPPTPGAAKHQGKVTRVAPHQVSRPGTARLQGNVLPEQVSRLPTSGVASSQGSIALKKVSSPTPSVVPPQKSITPGVHQLVYRPGYVVPMFEEISSSQVSRPVVSRPQERIAPKQVLKPTPPVVSRPRQTTAPRPAAATAINWWVPTLSTTEAPCPSERTATEDQQSKFISSLQFFFCKICCCLGDKK